MLSKTTILEKGRYTGRAVFYEVERRDGLRLAKADKVPFEWSDRRALAFRSRATAESFVREKFGVHGARMIGARVVRA